MLTRWFDTPVFPAPFLTRRPLFDDRRPDFERLWNHIEGAGASRFSWRVSDEEAILSAELPGLTVENLKLTVRDGTLSLEGAGAVKVPEGYRALRQERLPVRFQKNFNLSKEFDAEKADAQLKNGVLTIRIPKRPEAQPRTIPIAHA